MELPLKVSSIAKVIFAEVEFFIIQIKAYAIQGVGKIIAFMVSVCCTMKQWKMSPYNNLPISKILL